MSEFKGTPGPWSVINTADVFSALGAPSGDGVNADANDGWLIADCSNGFANVDGMHTELGFDVQKANAQLIAAAPDLLSIAMRLTALEGEWHLDRYGDEKALLLKDARTAIDKALGQ